MEGTRKKERNKGAGMNEEKVKRVKMGKVQGEFGGWGIDICRRQKKQNFEHERVDQSKGWFW